MSPFKTFLQALRGKAKAENPHDALLRQLPLFRTLTRRERGLIELILHERAYVAGEVVWSKGEEGLGMYIVVEGSVQAILGGASGEPRTVILGAGESFGEIALLEGEARTIDIVAAESPTRLLGLFRPDLVNLLEGHPRIGSKLAFELARGLARRFRRILDGERVEPVH